MKAIELFAGAGGLGLGVTRAGFEPLKIVEWDKWCCDTINHNRLARASNDIRHWPEPTHADVRTIDFRPFEDRVDIVSGGPPCQPFSLGGKHLAFDDRRDMWPEAVRAVREVRPKAFIFENVKGLTRAAFATYLSYINLQLHHPAIIRHGHEDWRDHYSKLQQHHTSGGELTPEYNVIYNVLNAADYGVPQKRERVVFVGIRSDLKTGWQFPQETHSLEALLWDICRTGEYWDRHRVPAIHRDLDIRLELRAERIACSPRKAPWQTVRDGLAGLPEPDTKEHGSFSNHRLQPGARSYPGHTGSPLDLPAKALKAGVHGVPGGENMMRLPDGSVRYFTIRESARLQTFPDSYELHGSWSEAMRQLGNAVPVRLAELIAKDVAACLRKAA